MPIATANLVETEHKKLKSLEGGEVELRRMTWGQMVDRRAMMKMSVSTDQKDKKSLQGELAMANREITRFEFRNCIVSHNLEIQVGEETRLLDFNKPEDFNALDPRVGSEIERYISEMNQFEDDDQEN